MSTQPIIVQKYGGSSVATPERLREVAKLVVERYRGGNRIVVVVSAMGKTTDGLIAQARSVSARPHGRELDMLVTAGERISMALLSMAIGDLGVEAISFTGSQSGIITDESHQNARVLEVRPERIDQELDRGRVVIDAGFQGVSRAREITTLGRGGSDTTAVALAAALHAETCEIYSDVDGVYSADPNVVPEAKLIPELAYVTMQTMAGAGAKVLNADAVEFARKAGIIIHARKTGDTSGRETRVMDDAREPAPVTAVVHSEAMSTVRCSRDALDETLRAVRDCGGRVVDVRLDNGALMVIDRTGVPGADNERLPNALPASMVTLAGTALLARNILGEALVGLDPRLVLASDLALSFVLEPGEANAVVKSLHQRFMDRP
ncbi:MAG: aspartate kinase [Clostridia bacterium]|nr:aspartate kinase [Deltaproteobacteria bacterium]